MERIALAVVIGLNALFIRRVLQHDKFNLNIAGDVSMPYSSGGYCNYSYFVIEYYIDESQCLIHQAGTATAQSYRLHWQICSLNALFIRRVLQRRHTSLTTSLNVSMPYSSGGYCNPNAHT